MAATYDDVMKTKPYLPYEMGYLTETMIQQAKEELGETEKTREDAISAMRKMVSAEPKFKIFAREQQMLPYLRTQKFNVKKAYKQIVNVSQVMNQYPEIFKNYKDHIPAVDQIWQTGICAWQPYRDGDGCPVIILRISKWDPDEHSIEVLLQALGAVCIFAINEEANTVTGIKALLDVKCLSLKHIRQISIRYMQLFAKAMRNCFAIRIKGVHIFNDSVWFQYIYGIFKLFLTEKIRKRIHFHGSSIEDLHQFIPKEILPADYGGLNDTDSDTVWFPKLIEQHYDIMHEIYQTGFDS